MRVIVKGFDRVIGVPAGMAQRARKIGRERKLETSDRLAVIHHHGARQQVVSDSQRRAIYFKVGAGQRVPDVGSVMVHPERPVRVTPRMAKDVALADARFIRLGGAQKGEQIMRDGVRAQFSSGGVPTWPASRDWGNLRARRPTLGGAGGRVAAGWSRARYVVRR